MLKYWRNAADQEMYHDWVGGVVEGATFKGGLYNPEPMTEFLASELADIEPMQRFVDIGITNFEKGTYQENFKDSLDQNLAEVLQASLTWAGFFPPYEFDDQYWLTGSVIYEIDIFSAVDKCLETHALEDIVLDVVLTHKRELKKVDAADFNSLENLLRAGEILLYYKQLDGLLRA